MKRLVILESPYAGDVDANVAYARRALRDSLSRGEYPIASHLLYTQPNVLDDSIPSERALGIAAGLAWREVAERAVFYVDRGWSTGMIAARDLYLREGVDFEVRRLDGGCYVSPIPAEFRLDYRVRNVEGNALHRRVHLWPRPDGGVDPCNPPLCRECERERSWHDHGCAAVAGKAI